MDTNETMPPGYQPGLKYLESLDEMSMKHWLMEELFDRRHELAGQADDYPVQAIINHYPYLSQITRQRLLECFSLVLKEWQNDWNTWGEQATSYFFSLIGELPLPSFRIRLKVLVKSEKFATFPLATRAHILGALAPLSYNSHSYKDDVPFWESLLITQPELKRMIYQVLGRIA